MLDLDPVEKVTTGAVGEPGRRTFYLQARSGIELVTVLVEKQQVELLASSILEILATVGTETGEGPGEEELDLDEPLEPRWRVGRLSIGYEETRDRMLLEIEELVPEDEEEDIVEEGPPGAEALAEALAEPDAPAVPEDLAEQVEEALAEDSAAEALPAVIPELIRVWATREQMLALSRHGAAVAAQGRPTCQFCGNPIDPEGHNCPAMNGHRGPRT